MTHKYKAHKGIETIGGVRHAKRGCAKKIQYLSAGGNPLLVMAWIAVYASDFRRPVSIYRKCSLMAQLTQGGVSASTFYPAPTRMQIEVMLSVLILRARKI